MTVCRPELYESAEIDAANEWIKFWHITMSLSKPILAVIALTAFTQAYSAFMMALIIIPDSKMWTLMVWIYQLQSQSHLAVVYASLVIAAGPDVRGVHPVPKPHYPWHRRACGEMIQIIAALTRSGGPVKSIRLTFVYHPIIL